MTYVRKKWGCPSCPHRSSRKYNMKVHIERWHKTVGQQPELLYMKHQAAYQFEDNKDIFSNVSPALGSNNVSNNSVSSSFNKFLSEKPEDPFEFVNEMYLKVMKFKEMQRKVEEMQRAISENSSHSTAFNTNYVVLANSKKPSMSSFSLPTFRANVSSSSPATINPQEIKKEEIAGFKAKVCETCMEIVIEMQYSVDISGKSPEVVTESHRCIVSTVPSKPITLERRTRQSAKILAKLIKLPWILKNAVKRWTDKDGQNNAYLVGFKLPHEKVKSNNIIDIYTLSVKNKMSKTLNNSNLYANETKNDKRIHAWALEVIKKGQVLLNDDNLLDFLNTAKNGISGFFRIHTNGLEESPELENSGCRNLLSFC
jgi:hypothetical protein